MEKIKSKKLHRSATALLTKMQNMLSEWQRNNLQFQSQEEETKRHFYRAIDETKRFTDNIL